MWEQPNSTSLLQWGFGGVYSSVASFQLEIADSGGHRVVPLRNSASFVKPGSFRWAPDSLAFAFIGKTTDAGESRVFRGNVGGSIDVVQIDRDIDPQLLFWVDDRRLLLGGGHSLADVGGAKRKYDWWLLPISDKPRLLTESLPSALRDLVKLDGHTVFGVSEGDLWRLDVDGGTLTNITTSFASQITNIVWPRGNATASPFITHDTIIVSVPQGMSRDLYRWNVASAANVRLLRPSDFATLVAYQAENDTAVFRATESGGSYLTMARGKSQRVLVETNEFLGGIAEGERRLVQYRGLDGRDLKAWLLLPPQYKPGTRYPMVTDVYIGNSIEDTPPPNLRLNFDWVARNLQLLAARGYVVLVPSMPLSGVPSDPYMELTKGVLPAIDKVIGLGIADPTRLSVMGHSYGGYSTYGLITQTNRFKAAVASAGISDFVSLYGTFSSPFRYEPFYQDYLHLPVGFETLWGRMGNPPWRDWSRYTRNSPLFYVDRVQTPVLIIQGDMDTETMSQGEEFFTALYRQGKRARFARYWGEGHSLSSPANIRHYWMEIYAWLDELCDISRDEKGSLVFDGDKVKSRNGGPPLMPADFQRFDELLLKEGTPKVH